MPSYLRADDITTRLQAAAARPENLCTFGTCPNATPGDPANNIAGRNPPFVEIHATTTPATPRTVVVVTGGVHAREWAPPDALVSFVEKMLDTKGTDPASYPLLTQNSPPSLPFPTSPDTPILYPAFTMNARSVQRIFNNIDLYIAPLMNPDGREFSRMPQSIVSWWRKNRRGNAGQCLDTLGNDQGIGVDINRNFDIGWEFTTLYASSFQSQIKAVATACPGPPTSNVQHDAGETFRGSVKMDEPEVKNMDWLQKKGARVFCDVHSAGPRIVYPWGLANGNQSKFPKQNIKNQSLDGTRDGTYAEFVPTATLARMYVLGGRMQHCVRGTQTLDPRLDSAKDPSRQRFTGEYDVSSSGQGLYVAPGAGEDYHFSRQFTVNASSTEKAAPPELFAYTIECGSQAQGSFWPDRTFEFPKIEREVHAALWGMLSFIASPAFTLPITWPIGP